MTNNKKRNHFPMIGKVYKYEFKNLSKMLLPFLSAMILVGLILGLFAPNIKFFKKESLEQAITLYETRKISLEELTGNVPTEININNEEIKDDSEYNLENPEIYFDTKLTKTVFYFFLIIFGFGGLIVFLYFIIFMDKRLTKGLVEKEAYFNFTLPVTIGEHITGRFLAYLTFAILWFVTIIISILLVGIKYFSIPLFKMINYSFYEVYVAAGTFPNLSAVYTHIPLSILSFVILFISFVFVEKAIEMMVKKSSKIFETFMEIPLIVCYFLIIIRLANAAADGQGQFRLPFMILNISLTIINIAITYFAYKKRINIE